MGQKGASATMVAPLSFPANGPIARLQDWNSPRFIVTVDTEEEFDWSGPFTRDQHGLSHLRAIDPFQKLCENNGVKPIYLVDYPVAADNYGAELFKGLVDAGRADVGLQLHPWVTPPFSETVNAHNSYACNLPPTLEKAKLQQLYDVIAERIGVEAQIYRAGRYGAGEATPDFLRELGVRIDSSVRSHFDYRVQGGPNFARCPLEPYWVKAGELLELPVTSIFAGAFRSVGPILFDRVFGSETMRSMLARGGMLERIALTPEGIPAEKAILAIDIAVEAGLPLLNFSFHSPSLAVGHTPYVRNEAQLEQFYAWWDAIFAHLKARGVMPASVGDIIKAAFDG